MIDTTHTRTASTVCFPAGYSMRHAVAVGAMVLWGSVASAQVPPAPGAGGIDASGNTGSERAACMRGATQQDRATCLKEANNAAIDKRRGLINDHGQPLSANAMQRCGVLQNPEDRAACEARIGGRGTTSGSVAGGGLIREVETVVLPADGRQVRVRPTTEDPVLLAPRP